MTVRARRAARGRPGAGGLAGVAVAASIVFATIVPAAGEVRSVAVHVPRTFGYFIGDAIPVTIEIVADPGDRLDAASLPRPGPLDYWLDLTSVAVDETEATDARRITVRLGLQTFYAALEPRALDIPAFQFSVTGPGGTSTASAPSWRVTVSPLREIMPRDGDDPTRIRPDASPVFRSARGPTAILAGSAAVALAGLTLLAVNRAWWPFHRRPARPFTRAARDIARLRRQGDDAAVTAAYLALHRAFDAAAGRRLLADDVPGFFDSRPEFAASAAATAAFFARSRALFFEGAGPPTVTAAAIPEVLDLAHRLAAAERRRP